jgi:hypothetical protein
MKILSIRSRDSSVNIATGYRLDAKIKKNTEAQLDAGMESGLKMKADKNYLFTSRHKNAGQNHNTKAINKSF